LRPGFGSLLVGVNDVVQAVPGETFKANVAAILDGMLAALPRRRIIIVSTPDYTVTPEGATYGDPSERRRTIVAFNDILADLARGRGIAFVDVFDLSQLARDDPSLVAADGLHPGGGQYRMWADRIAPVVEGLLES
jgi:lysophospholipase L1-like esterase